MTFVQGEFGKQRVARVILPAAIYEALTKMSIEANVSFSEIVRQALESELEPILHPGPKGKVALPPLPKHVEKATDRAGSTVIEMAALGYSLTQIATIKRMPYRDVAAELGRKVDAVVVGGKSSGVMG